MKKKIFVLLISMLACSGCSAANHETNTVSAVQDTEKQSEMKEAQTSEGEAASDDEAVVEVFAMDTYITIKAYGKNANKAVAQAQERVEELDKQLSTGLAESEVSQLNAKGGGALSDETTYLMKRSLEICESTNGAFNPIMYPIMEAWGFTKKTYQVPEKGLLQQLLTYTDIQQLTFDERQKTVTFGIQGMKLDFGGIAKGYTSAQIMDIFKTYGVESGMVSLGGNVQVLGNKVDGTPWRVGIQNPNTEEEYLGVLEVTDKAVITSGGYERYFEENGTVYHHIIDPATGYPAESGLDSVTIVSTDGTLADGLSTALFVMGLEKAEEYWKSNRESFDAILHTKEGQLYVTEGIADEFSSDFEYSIIK